MTGAGAASGVPNSWCLVMPAVLVGSLSIWLRSTSERVPTLRARSSFNLEPFQKRKQCWPTKGSSSTLSSGALLFEMPRPCLLFFVRSYGEKFIVQALKRVNRLSTYQLRTLEMESGERLRLLFSATSSEPLYDALMFNLFMLRARGLAHRTVDQALRSVMLLLTVFDKCEVDLERCLRERVSLKDYELEAVFDACSYELSEIQKWQSLKLVAGAKSIVRISEHARMRSGIKPLKQVQEQTRTIRLLYIRKYLEWLVETKQFEFPIDSVEYHHLLTQKNVIKKFFSERTPSSGSRNTLDQRSGLEPSVRARLLEVIEIDHPENPWGRCVRERNRLIVLWYYHTGVRRAELLGVKVADINFQQAEVLIARRPIDVEDSRRDKPDAKTRDRVLPIARTLAKDTHDYVVKARRRTGRARSHPFLLVATGSGSPLTLSAVNAVFAALRRKVPGIPDDFCPHVLRHTWNDRFSELSDKERLEPAEEKKMRSNLMGWSETSSTAETYTRRHVRRKARKASLAMQDGALGDIEI